MYLNSIKTTQQEALKYGHVPLRAFLFHDFFICKVSIQSPIGAREDNIDNQSDYSSTI
jgi:hypothetical protein